MFEKLFQANMMRVMMIFIIIYIMIVIILNCLMIYYYGTDYHKGDLQQIMVPTHSYRSLHH